MIKVYKKGESIQSVLKRTQFGDSKVNSLVSAVLEDIKENGDKAVFGYCEKFDNTQLDSSNLYVSEQELEQAYKAVDSEMLTTMRKAINNILEYHKKQIQGDSYFTQGGSTIGWMFKPVERAGVYVPGGTAAYQSTVMMNVLPAVAAGVKEIIMATPFKSGVANPFTLVAANECGVKKILKVGGSQAIGALAYGTESIPKVDVITGPGNIFVTMAKKQVFGQVNIDMIAGPSEILIIADESAKPKFLACDLLSQAEHDMLSAGILITTSEKLAFDTQIEIDKQLQLLSRREIANKSVEDNGAIIIVDSIDEAFNLSNTIAPEHLELCFEGAKDCLNKVKNAGAVFIGNYSPEALGDYYAGPNHTLPTSGTARHFSVLSTSIFLKRISVINYDFTSLLHAKDDIIRLAECEGLQAHANSIRIRFENK